jgi:hypothetical protein
MSGKNAFRLILAFVAAASFNAVLADDRAKGPRMQLEQSSYDFGTVVQGTAVKHVFKFKNVGTDTLRIEKVKTSCGCTAAWESSKIIPPQKDGQIEVTFNTSSQLGKASKTVYVLSNDVEAPRRNLSLHGIVEAKKPETSQK